MKHALLFLTGLLTFGTAHAAPITYFDGDFDNAIDYGSTIVDNGKVLQTVFGDPSLENGALRFNTGGADTYEQVRLNIDNNIGHKSYHIEFDLLTENLANSQWSFSAIIDTPTVQNLSFNNCCNNRISAFNTQTATPTTLVGYLTDDQWMHVSIDIDLIAESWTIAVSGVGQITDEFYSSSGGLESLRFNLSPAYGGIDTPNPSINVHLDNLVVTSVPVPAAIWLFTSGLITLLASARRNLK